jgi:amino acid transporter
MSKIFIWFFCLLILAFFLPTHPFFESFFETEILPNISTDYFIISIIGLLGIVLVYFSGLVERAKLRKELKKYKTINYVKDEPKKQINEKDDE